MGNFYGFQKRVSTGIFWIEHEFLELHATGYLDICHAWIKERDHSKMTLLLQLNHGLHNSFINA